MKQRFPCYCKSRSAPNGVVHAQVSVLLSSNQSNAPQGVFDNVSIYVPIREAEYKVDAVYQYY